MSATACECFWTDPSTWLSAASCGYGSGYEPGSQMEWNPDCPMHGDPMTTDAPIYDHLIAAHPDVAAAMIRPRWSYAAALKAADEAIAARTEPKRPAKKAAARKGAS